MAKIIIALTLVLFSGSASAEFLWKNVGGDPYKGPRATLERALELSGWELEIQRAFKEEVERSHPEIVSVKSGDHFDFVTFGNGRVEHNVVASWEKSRLYAADLYTLTLGLNTYELLRVWKCGNWAGRLVFDTLVLRESTDDFGRGDIPVTNCSGSLCDACN